MESQTATSSPDGGGTHLSQFDRDDDIMAPVDHFSEGPTPTKGSKCSMTAGLSWWMQEEAVLKTMCAGFPKN